jgi:DNA polymerase-3 subunit epsilon
MEPNKKYCFFDLETTSLNIEKARIVEIAYLIVKNNKIEKQVDEIIKPKDYVIPEETIAIHRITNEIANEKGKEIEEVFMEMKKDIEEVKYIVGHNIKKYDIPVLLNNLRREGIEIDTTKYEVEDTIEYARIKLGNMYKYIIGEELKNAHNALSDVIATYKCYEKLKLGNIDIKKMIEENEKEKNRDRDKNIIRFGKYVNYPYSKLLEDKRYCKWIIEQNDTKEIKIMKSYIMDRNMERDTISKNIINLEDIKEMMIFNKNMNKIIEKIKIETYKYDSKYKMNKNRMVSKEIYYNVIDYLIRYYIMKSIKKNIYEYKYGNENEEEKKYINLVANLNDIIKLVERKVNKKITSKNIIDEGSINLVKEFAGYMIYENLNIENVYLDMKIGKKQIYSNSYIKKNNNLVGIYKSEKKFRKEEFMEMIIYGIMIEKKYDKIMIYDINNNQIYTMDGNIEYGNIKEIIINKFI